MFMVDLDTDSYYNLLGVEPTASASEIRQARDRLIQDLRERQRREATRREELLERQKQVNAAGEVLARPANREQYDRDHAHLRFFTVRTAAAGMFVDVGDRLDALQRAIREHMREVGRPLPPASDLEREDFPEDLTPSPVLDGPSGWTA